MSVEFREWNGMQMTFWVGMREPVWLVAEIARRLGDVPRAARRWGVRLSQLRAMLQYVQSHARRVEYERELALESGFEVPPVETPVLTLVFPADAGQFREESLESPAAGRPRDQGRTDDWSLYPICFRSPPPPPKVQRKRKGAN